MKVKQWAIDQINILNGKRGIQPLSYPMISYLLYNKGYPFIVKFYTKYWHGHKYTTEKDFKKFKVKDKMVYLFRHRMEGIYDIILALDKFPHWMPNTHTGLNRNVRGKLLKQMDTLLKETTKKIGSVYRKSARIYKYIKQKEFNRLTGLTRTIKSFQQIRHKWRGR